MLRSSGGIQSIPKMRKSIKVKVVRDSAGWRVVVCYLQKLWQMKTCMQGIITVSKSCAGSELSTQERPLKPGGNVGNIITLFANSGNDCRWCTTLRLFTEDLFAHNFQLKLQSNMLYPGSARSLCYIVKTIITSSTNLNVDLQKTYVHKILYILYVHPYI